MRSERMVPARGASMPKGRKVAAAATRGRRSTGLVLRRAGRHPPLDAREVKLLECEARSSVVHVPAAAAAAAAAAASAATGAERTPRHGLWRRGPPRGRGAQARPSSSRRRGGGLLRGRRRCGRKGPRRVLVAAPRRLAHVRPLVPVSLIGARPSGAKGGPPRASSHRSKVDGCAESVKSERSACADATGERKPGMFRKRRKPI